MERIEFASLSTLRTSKEWTTSQFTIMDDLFGPDELLSTILLKNNGRNGSHTPFMVTLHVVGGVWEQLILRIACISPV